MQDACSDLETEIAELEKESVTLLADIKSTIGDLSDLRFGKFNRVSGISGDLSQEVIKGLERLEYLCNAVEKGWIQVRIVAAFDPTSSFRMVWELTTPLAATEIQHLERIPKAALFDIHSYVTVSRMLWE